MPTRHRGALLILITTFVFALHDASAKYLTLFYAVPLVIWARYSVHLLIMLVTVAPKAGWSLIVTERPGLMVFRALMLLGVSLLFQTALKNLPIAETSALMFVAPFFVALLSGPVLNEKVGYVGWLATIAGFVGVVLIARPGGALSGIGVAYALGSALCYAAYQMLTRKLASTEPAMRQLFYTALIGTIATSLVVPQYWEGAQPTLAQVALFASLGLTAGVGHFMFTWAAKETPASTLATLLYMQLVWVTLLGWIVFGHLPDLPGAIGMTIICASGLALALRRASTAKPSARN